MKIQPYIEKLNNSKKFSEFKSSFPESYFSAGFFVIDFENKKNMHQIDYYNPKNKKMTTFELDGEEIVAKESAQPMPKTPEKINEEINLDLDILKGIVEDEMKNHTITHKLHKIIAVIQNNEGELVWNLNCITSDMGVVKVHILDKNHSVLKFETVNLFDIVKKI